MKPYLILINQVLSFSALSIDTEKSSLTAVLAVIVWFAISTLITARAYNRGYFNKFSKHFN